MDRGKHQSLFKVCHLFIVNFYRWLFVIAKTFDSWVKNRILVGVKRKSTTFTTSRSAFWSFFVWSERPADPLLTLLTLVHWEQNPKTGHWHLAHSSSSLEEKFSKKLIRFGAIWEHLTKYISASIRVSWIVPGSKCSCDHGALKVLILRIVLIYCNYWFFSSLTCPALFLRSRLACCTTPPGDTLSLIV